MEFLVRKFIEDLESIDIDKSSIVRSLYEIFSKSSHHLYEKFIYGGIGIYIEERLIGGIYVSKKHVSLVFSKGNELFDKYNVLLGTGKWRRHIAIESFDEIETKYCEYYINQIINIENDEKTK